MSASEHGRCAQAKYNPIQSDDMPLKERIIVPPSYWGKIWLAAISARESHECEECFHSCYLYKLFLQRATRGRSRWALLEHAFHEICRITVDESLRWVLQETWDCALKELRSLGETTMGLKASKPIFAAHLVWYAGTCKVKFESSTQDESIDWKRYRVAR